MSKQNIDLRPRAELPDWSAVRSEVARQALQAAVDAVDMGRKWVGLDAAEYSVWRALLAGYASAGVAPIATDLIAATRLSAPEVEDALDRLRRRDLVVLAADGRIVGAYPFTDRATGHRVEVDGKPLTAMCAVDALGLGAMLDADTMIRSACRRCGVPIEITTRDKGQSLGAVTLDTAVVWSGAQYANACAATSLCTVQAFFCSDEHLAAWRADDARGVRLTIDEALQVGKAIFGPMLRGPTPEGPPS